MTKQVAIHDSMPDCWAELSRGAPLFASAPWLSSQGPRLEGRPRWIVLARDGSPVAGVFGVVVAEPGPQRTTNLQALVTGRDSVYSAEPGANLGTERLEHLASIPLAAWFPNFLVTYPGYDSFIVGPESPDLDSCKELIDSILAWAGREHVSAVGFPYVGREQTVLPRALEESGFDCVELTVRAQLSLPGRSFDDYLAALPAKRRGEIRRERDRIREAGLRVDAGPLESCVADVVRLRCAHRRKYGNPCSEPAERDLFEDLAHAMGANVTVFRCLRGDQAISMGIFLRDGDRWIALVTGTDYGDPNWRFTYFETAFYTPIASAYHRGIRTISYGMTDADAKRRRGCDLTPVEAWFRFLS